MLLLLFGLIPSALGLALFYRAWAKVFGWRQGLVAVGCVLSLLFAPAAYQYVVLKTLDFREFEGKNLEAFKERAVSISLPGDLGVCGSRCNDLLKMTDVQFIERDSSLINRDILRKFQK